MKPELESLAQRVLEAAEKATPGKWVSALDGSWVASKGTDDVIARIKGMRAQILPDAAYISLASPANITAVILAFREELKQARRDALESASPLICRFCADGDPVERDEHGTYIHTFDNRQYVCHANVIRVLIGEQP